MSRTDNSLVYFAHTVPGQGPVWPISGSAQRLPIDQFTARLPREIVIQFPARQ